MEGKEKNKAMKYLYMRRERHGLMAHVKKYKEKEVYLWEWERERSLKLLKEKEIKGASKWHNKRRT